MGQAIDDTRAYRISHGREHDGQSAAEMLQSCHGYGAAGQDDVGREREQFRGIFCAPVGVVLGPADVDPHITSNIPAQFLQALVERCKSILTFRVVRSPVHEDTNSPRTFWLLRPRCERPRCRAAEQRDELAPSHSITSSAMASSDGGTVRPSILAVSTLMASSSFDDCTTGSS